MKRKTYIAGIIFCFIVMGSFAELLEAQNITVDCNETPPKQYFGYINLSDFCNAKKGLRIVKAPSLGSPVHDPEGSIISFIGANGERLRLGLERNEPLAIEVHDILREVIIYRYEQALDLSVGNGNDGLALPGSSVGRVGTGSAAKCFTLELVAGTRGFELPKYEYYFGENFSLNSLPREPRYRLDQDSSGYCECDNQPIIPLIESGFESPN